MINSYYIAVGDFTNKMTLTTDIGLARSNFPGLSIVGYKIDLNDIFCLKNESTVSFIKDKFPQFYSVNNLEEQTLPSVNHEALGEIEFLAKNLGYKGFVVSSNFGEIFVVFDYSIINRDSRFETMLDNYKSVAAVVKISSLISPPKSLGINTKAFKSYLTIEDEEICEALNLPELKEVNVKIGSEEDKNGEWSNQFSHKSKTEKHQFHVKRIAKLVQEYKRGVNINPIKLQIYEGVTNVIADGNHRVRALAFINADTVDAIIEGDSSLIDQFLDS